MRLHYCFNPSTGQWFLGSFLLSPTAAEEFLKEQKLEGFQVLGVDLIDAFFLKVKLAIDNRNMIAENAYNEALAQEAKKATAALGQVSAEQQAAARVRQTEVIVPPTQDELFNSLPDYAQVNPAVIAMKNASMLTPGFASGLRSLKHDSVAGKKFVEDNKSADLVVGTPSQPPVVMTDGKVSPETKDAIVKEAAAAGKVEEASKTLGASDLKAKLAAAKIKR